MRTKGALGCIFSIIAHIIHHIHQPTIHPPINQYIQPCSADDQQSNLSSVRRFSQFEFDADACCRVSSSTASASIGSRFAETSACYAVIKKSPRGREPEPNREDHCHNYYLPTTYTAQILVHYSGPATHHCTLKSRPPSISIHLSTSSSSSSSSQLGRNFKPQSRFIFLRLLVAYCTTCTYWEFLLIDLHLLSRPPVTRPTKAIKQSVGPSLRRSVHPNFNFVHRPV